LEEVYLWVTCKIFNKGAELGQQAVYLLHPLTPLLDYVLPD